MELLGNKKARTEHLYVEDRLSAYLDGQLSSRERAAVDRHLKTCAHCRWNLDTLRQTVQLTRSLPTVPVPRVFTVPVPAQGARARQRAPQRRPWGLPVLQGATVLVAVMFFLAVASEFALTGLLPASVPEPVAMFERAPQATEISDPVAEVEEKGAVTEIAAEAPDEAAVSSVAETAVSSVVEAVVSAVGEATASSVVETAVSAVAEAEVVTESPALAADSSPLPEPAATEEVQAAAEALVVEAELVEETVTASPEAGAGAMGGVQPPSTGEVEEAAERRAAEEAPKASAGMTTTADLPTAAPSPTVEPDLSPTLMPTLVPTFAATVVDVSEPAAPEPEISETEEPGLAEAADAAPTVLAEVQEPAPSGREQEVAEPAGLFRDSVTGWLGTAEIALGIVFLLLAITTIVVMYRHRRAM